MKLSEIRVLLQNKISSLESQKQLNIELWNIDTVLSLENEINETQLSLNEII